MLFPWRTVLDNVLLPIDVQGLSRDRHRAAALDLLALVGLEGFELIDEINRFDPEKIAAEARAYRAGG